MDGPDQLELVGIGRLARVGGARFRHSPSPERSSRTKDPNAPRSGLRGGFRETPRSTTSG